MTADHVKRDKRTAEALKKLDTGMLDVAIPILNLPESNVFRELAVKRSLASFDYAKDIVATRIKEAHKSANHK